MENYIESLKGHFLIAMPNLLDPNFSKTIICMCEHTKDGAIGVIVNKTYNSLSSKDVFNELKLKYNEEMGNMPIYIGGPVHIEQVFVLHGPPFNWKGCLKINSSVALSNTKDIIEAIALGTGPEDAIIILGCAGWAPQQLEKEFKENSWITSPISRKIIFETPLQKRWDACLEIIGIDPNFLSSTAGHA